MDFLELSTKQEFKILNLNVIKINEREKNTHKKHSSDECVKNAARINPKNKLKIHIVTTCARHIRLLVCLYANSLYVGAFAMSFCE